MSALFESVNRVALSRLPSLLPEWLPNGHVRGREYECGDLKGHPGRSLKVNVDTGRWADFAGDVKGSDVISLYAAIHNLMQGEAARELAQRLGIDIAASNGNRQATGTQNNSSGKQSAPPPKPSTRPALDDAKRAEIALRVWHQSKPALGTLAETYLRRRGITIPVPATLRFHRALKHPSGPILLPAMVAVVSDLTRNVVAVHRTYLDSQGNKTKLEPPKAALGPIAGRAVHLAPAGETIALAEGIETALSVQQATGIPTWATLGTSNFAKVELPECVRELIICADSDEPGERAAREAAARFMREGRRVRIARPMSGDFNDALQA